MMFAGTGSASTVDAFISVSKRPGDSEMSTLVIRDCEASSALTLHIPLECVESL